jgi:glyoxylase-like metal-dependent hydrolase (beta-lactamase superfamily II)
MTVLAPGLRYVDVRFQGARSVIATAVLEARGHVALVDPGPTSTLGGLRAGLEAGGIEVADLEAILLTHIHLDHAGATGTLLRENPDIKVYVHERGARHLVDPTKLLASATRIYGDLMDRLWGPFVPVPADRIVMLTGGEAIEAGGRSLDVAYTPGHASHHVSYFDRDSRIAFVGDVAGVALPGSSFVLPPTPPPDVDLDAWAVSVDRVLAWHPESLFLTHFGVRESPPVHFQVLLERLRAWADLARECLALDAPDRAPRDCFVQKASRELRRNLSEADAARYELAVPPWQCWLGLERYWVKKSG